MFCPGNHQYEYRQGSKPTGLAESSERSFMPADIARHQDLIYKRGQAGVTKASVTIVFDNRDKKTSPIGFEEYAQISVTRQIVLGGTSKYLINGHRAQQQTVQNLFQSVQLNINNPNFLIMQGRITKVLNMKAVEILAMIEEAAGTRMFEDRRDKAIKTMGKKGDESSRNYGVIEGRDRSQA